MKKLLFLILLTPFAYAQSTFYPTSLTANDWLSRSHYAMGTYSAMNGIIITNYCINYAWWELITTTEGKVLNFAPRPSGESNTSFLCQKLSKEKWMQRYNIKE